MGKGWQTEQAGFLATHGWIERGRLGGPAFVCCGRRPCRVSRSRGDRDCTVARGGIKNLRTDWGETIFWHETGPSVGLLHFDVCFLDRDTLLRAVETTVWRVCLSSLSSPVCGISAWLFSSRGCVVFLVVNARGPVGWLQPSACQRLLLFGSCSFSATTKGTLR